MSVGTSGRTKHVAHNVYFSLRDSSPKEVERLLAGCRKHLTNHDGVVYFAAGTPSDLSRPVNDRDFDVALHLVFSDRAAHDAYQEAPRHLQFIAENKDNWAHVRVFDSDVESA